MIGTLLAVAIVVFGAMLAESRLAARNEQRQRARGGVEPEGDVYAVMRVAYPACFAAMLAEGVAGGGPAGSRAAVAGALVFAAAKALKYWAIRSLGPFWTFRVIVVPGTRLVSSGPYRYVHHPNYIAVVGELAGVALMARARWTGPLAIAFFSLLMWRRVRVERRALDAILPPS